MEDDSERGVLGRLASLLKKKTPIANSDDLEEEIQGLIDEGHARGLISDEESDMVSGVLELKETRAHSIMVPRTEISSAPLDATLGDIIALVKVCGHTRIPIHKDSVDKITGILHAKDLLKLWGRDPASRIPSDILRGTYFVPGTQTISQLLRDFKEQKTHLAIVTDEYGGTAGIITIEDILEEIVGEIRDEHDTEEPLLTVFDDGSLSVDARLEIGKLQEHLSIPIPDGDYESVGGFIISLLGRIPEINEKISFQKLQITITEADQRKIDKVLIEQQIHPDSSRGAQYTRTRQATDS